MKARRMATTQGRSSQKAVQAGLHRPVAHSRLPNAWPGCEAWERGR